MKKIAALTIAVGVILFTGTANAQGWQAWQGTRGPMLFQEVGAPPTTQNCFGDCNSPTLRHGVTSSQRVITQQRVIPDEIVDYDVEYSTVYPSFPIFVNGFPASWSNWGWGWF